jgi:hypothetical protein
MTMTPTRFAQDGDPQEGVLRQPYAVGWLHRIDGAKHGDDHRNHVGQGHTDHSKHVRPAQPERIDDWRFRNIPVRIFFDERGRLVYLAADDVADDDYDEAEQEGDSPAPGDEAVSRHVERER